MYDFWKNLKEGYDYFEVANLPPKITVCEKHYLVNAVFVDRGARPDPAGACPAWQRLPVSRAPAEQVASAKKEQIALLTKPLGSVLGLTFGPSKPAYRAFTLGPATPDTDGGSSADASAGQGQDQSKAATQAKC